MFHFPCQSEDSLDLARSTIAITGATGFLGGYLVDCFLGHGARVVAVVRNPKKAASMAERGVEIRRADLAEPDALADAFRGTDAVIANAAQVSFTKPEQTFQTNLEGTRNVFDAMHTAGVRRCVAVSSSVVYNFSPFLLDENTPLRETGRVTRLNGYAVSKAAAEKEAWALAERHGIDLTTVRPCAITGPGDPMFMRAFRTLMGMRIAPYPILGQLGLAHGADVAEAIALAVAKTDVAAGKAYNLAGTTTAFWDIPGPWRQAGGKAPRMLLPIPTPAMLRYDDQRARRELGWEPRGVRQIFDDVLANDSAAH